VAKRRKFSRWRRLPGLYRFGDEKAPNPNLEPQRLTLYVPGVALDDAQEQANRLGFENIQDYCGDLLVRAIDAESVREHVAGVEARRGTLEGLHEIADDPEYLADLSAATAPRSPAPGGSSERDPMTMSVRIEGRRPGPPIDTRPAPVADRTDRAPSLTLSTAALVVMRHAGQAEEDPDAFLACLRRGDPVPPSEVGELAQALHELETEYRGSPAMDRRLTFALHRLAFESQILHTDAWPGSFDLWTVDMLRAVQEAVERILSGQDIRYYPDPNGADPGPRPETPP